MKRTIRLRILTCALAAMLLISGAAFAANPADDEIRDSEEETIALQEGGDVPDPENPDEPVVPTDPYVVTKDSKGLTVTYNGEAVKSANLAILEADGAYTVVEPGTKNSVIYALDTDGKGTKLTGKKIVTVTYKDTEKTYYVAAGKVGTAKAIYYVLVKSYVYKVQKSGVAAKATKSGSGTWKKSFSGKLYAIANKTAKASLFTGMYKKKCYKKGKLTKGWQTIGKKKYYCKKGVPVKGLQKISKKWYYFNTKGVLVKKDTTEKKVTYYLNKKGLVEAYKKKGVYYLPNGKKMSKVKREDYKTLRTARDVVAKITNKSMTKQEKLKTCFDYVIKFTYKRWRTPFPADDPTWPSLYANDHFNKGSGDCHSDAAAFAYLARALGYTNVYVCLDAVLSNPNHHAWATVDGLVYDPLFAEAKSYSKYYAASSYELSAIVKEKVGVGFIGDK